MGAELRQAHERFVYLVELLIIKFELKIQIDQNYQNDRLDLDNFV